MPGKTVPISVRLTPEDAAFIAQLNVEGAHTPSEKMRAIVVDARQRKLGTEGYPESLKLAQEMLAPTLRIIRTAELEYGMHSELISRLGEWIPEAYAYLVASNGPDTKLDAEALKEIERALAQRVFVLVQSVLQMAVTRSSPVYDAHVVSEGVQPALELAQVILDGRRQ